jgi:peptidoglycan/LPS O-acetylase OafA/YrhL
MQLVRPNSENGPVIAAGVVVLTTLVYVLNVRFDGTWGQGIHLIYSGLAAGAVVAMAAMAPREGERQPAWQALLYVAAFVLALAALVNLADVLGADDPPNASGTIVWVGSLLVGLTAWLATSRDSGISTLLAAVTFGAVALAFVDWVFSPEEVDTFRWILLLLTVGFALVAASQRDARAHHAVGFVNAAGLSALGLGSTFAVEAFLGGLFGGGGGSAEAGWGWELFLLCAGFALVAYAVIDRQSGPGYLGVANLLLFLVIAAGPDPDGASLIGWPLVLIAVAGALLTLGLRRVRPG